MSAKHYRYRPITQYSNDDSQGSLERHTLLDLIIDHSKDPCEIVVGIGRRLVVPWELDRGIILV